jgi:hypothetical protein
MKKEYIETLFKNRYNQENWKQFLGEAFTEARLLKKAEPLIGIDENVASQVQRLGYVVLNENGIERHIAVFEVVLAEGIILERNRVGLRNLLRKYWKNIDAAFIVYHRPGITNWRFTYVSELTGYNTEGEFVQIKTEPKRYTYVLGEGESTRTAADRFAGIVNKGSKTTLEDVKEAFSVEKLSKAFFDEYLKLYKGLCDYMINKPGIKATIFNGDEKAIRDFNKKLLGRIVFLYFIQKKGWMGVPIKEDWGKGDFNFLTNQFANYRNKDLFYKEFLTILFFETLNTNRKDDIFNFDNQQFLSANSQVKIPFLSGGLFDEDDKKQRAIIIPAQLMGNIFDFFNQYNFTIYEDAPNDHTVAVDPEMLGHIFENLLEDNKDKGAFYTPKEIVHYMCQESLIEYLTTWFENKGYEVVGYTNFDNPNQPTLFSVNEGRKGQMVLEIDNTSSSKKIDRLLIEQLLKKKLAEEDKKVILKHSAEFHAALDNVKICDPAIGSGAFPMGLLHEIFTAKQTLHSFEYGNTKTFDASSVKLNIIQNSIYGVDIEKGAVDIARLRFWLSLIVDENIPRALPNLDYKIVVGNSLVSKLGDEIIDIDWDVKATTTETKNLRDQIAKNLNKLFTKQKQYFAFEGKKVELQAEIRAIKIDLLISQLNLDKYKYSYNNKNNGVFFELTAKEKQQQAALKLKLVGYDHSIKKLLKLKDSPHLPLHFFDWKLDFPEVMNEQVANKIGFDIVIGNPPYVQLQKMVGSEVYASLNFETYSKSTDIYCLFYEKGITLLRQKGSLCFITSNSWLRTKYGLAMRKYFIAKSNPTLLINFEDVQIFQTAVVESNIILTQKNKWMGHLKASTLGAGLEKNTSISNYIQSNSILINNLDENGWIISDTTSFLLKLKIESNSTLLGNLGLRINIGINTGLNEVFLINENVKNLLINKDDNNKKLLVPILRGRDLKRYNYTFSNIYLINSHNGIKSKNIEPINVKKDYPTVFQYFIPFEEKLKNRYDQGKHWTNLRNCAYLEDFSKPKIIWGELSDKAKFTFDETGYFLDATVFLMTGKNLKYILAIFNSKIAQWYFEQIATSSGMGTNRWKKYKIEQFPIKVICENKMIIFEKIVSNIINNKSDGKDTSSLEQQIDNLVYKLYELTYDEVKLIDPLFALSPSEYEAISIE